MPPPITDAFMMAQLGTARSYVLVLLKRTDRYLADAPPDSEQRRVVWEHGRRNFELRQAGKLAVVGPIYTPPYAGIGVFDTSADEARQLMEADPGVLAGLFTFEVLDWKSFPGDALPGKGA